MEVASLKSQIRDAVEEHRQELIDLSIMIHSHPELGFEEEKACEWLTGFLGKYGFHVERGIAGLPTAFRATYGRDSPVVALLAEYDALPGIGHACGHNIIATSSVGAAMAARLAVDKFGGTVAVLGTPAEELYGGKAIMAEKGIFQDIAAAMLVHPAASNTNSIQALACIGLDIEFFGKAAHASSSPSEGINALEAMIQAFNHINSLRQHIRERARLHGIITDGGQAANIIPAHSAGSFLVRAEDEDYLEILKGKVLSCFQSAAVATGARLEYKWAEPHYMAMRTNNHFAEVFARNLEAAGRRVQSYHEERGMGSTDMGNVSQKVPSIHPSISIVNPGIVEHTAEFAQAAASEEGHRGMLDAAKAMAMTVYDLLSNHEVLAKVTEEFCYGA